MQHVSSVRGLYRRARTILLVIAVFNTVALVGSAPAHAQGTHTGIENILWPVALVAAPFIAVHTFIFGSDDKSREQAEAEAKRILQAHPGRIPVRGLYMGSLPLEYALFGMLVESRLPFIEIDTIGSNWLLSQAKHPRPLFEMAQRRRHIRLSIGGAGHPDCFEWSSPLDDLSNKPAVRPGRCLRVSFTDTLDSDVALEVDARQVAKRRLQWVLKDRRSGSIHLAVPFWQSQLKGKPLSVSTVYREPHENYIFIRVLRTLAPVGPVDNPDGRAHLLWRMKAPARRIDWPQGVAHPRVTLLAAGAAAGPIEAPAGPSWKEAYAEAYASGRPVVVNHHLVVEPRGHRYGPACVDLVFDCIYSSTFVAGDSLVSVKSVPSRAEATYARLKVPGHGMQVYVMSRDLDNRLEWYTTVELETVPDVARACADPSRECRFSVSAALVRANSLILRGRVAGSAKARGGLPDHELELEVSLADAFRPGAR